MCYPFSENKGVDQLRGYREADLRLCFRICKCWFSHDAAQFNSAVFNLWKVKTMQRPGTETPEPKSSPQNKNGKILKLQIVKILREHMVNRVSSYFPKGGHSATQTKLKIMVKRHWSSDTLKFWMLYFQRITSNFQIIWRP